MALLVQSIIAAIDFINIILHVVGVILLIILYHNGDQSYQHLYILNLGCADLIWNVIAASISILEIVASKDYHTRFAVWTALWTGINYNVICAMFYITGDRLLQVCLNLKYELYWSAKKTSILIIVTWFINVTISTCFAVTCAVGAPYSLPLRPRLVDKIYGIVDSYVSPCLQVLYLIFASATYIVMFAKYVKSKRTFQQQSDPSSSSALM